VIHELRLLKTEVCDRCGAKDLGTAASPQKSRLRWGRYLLLFYHSGTCQLLAHLCHLATDTKPWPSFPHRKLSACISDNDHMCMHLGIQTTTTASNTLDIQSATCHTRRSPLVSLFLRASNAACALSSMVSPSMIRCLFGLTILCASIAGMIVG
jgi:hypothetical protein